MNSRKNPRVSYSHYVSMVTVLQGYTDDFVSLDFKLKYVLKNHTNFLGIKADGFVVFVFHF